MEPFKYTKATINDVQTLVEYRIRFALELAGEQPSDNIKQLQLQLKNYFEKAIKDDTCISCIARSGETIAGVGSVVIREQGGNFKNPSGKWGYIMNMYTVPAFRRKGICKSILNFMMNEVKAMGITAFELHATKDGEFVYIQEGFQMHTEPTYRKFISSS